MEGVAFTPSAATQQQAYILCADCGTPIPPNSANRCVNCLRNSVDITESIPKQAAISFCRNCDRWLSPPQAWLIAELESRELLAICLRKLKGLKEVRLVDAGFIWTEPHSKRLRVKLTVQKEVSLALLIQRCSSVPLWRDFTSEITDIHSLWDTFKGLLFNSLTTSIRNRICHPIHPMSRLYKTSSQEHMESLCPSPSKSRPQTYFFILGTAYPEAWCR